MIAPDPVVTEGAACKGVDPDVFFPGPWETDKVKVALAYCDRCVVRAECLAEAMGCGPTLGGIWGGTTARQRARRVGRRTPAF